jgi:hypothetical protein
MIREGREAEKRGIILTNGGKGGLRNLTAIKACITAGNHPVIRKGLVLTIPREAVLTEPRIVDLTCDAASLIRRICLVGDVENKLLRICTEEKEIDEVCLGEIWEARVPCGTTSQAGIRRTSRLIRTDKGSPLVLGYYSFVCGKTRDHVVCRKHLAIHFGLRCEDHEARAPGKGGKKTHQFAAGLLGPGGA